MNASDDSPPTVAYVGGAPAVDHGGEAVVERVDAADVVDVAPGADCVVVELPGASLDVLAALEDTTTPTVLYDREGDPSVAARATRLGVTEYVTDESLGEETLADRIAAVARAAAELDRTREERERTLRQYKAILETVREMVFVIGEGARLELLTRPLADRFGYDREELLDAPVTSLVDDDIVQKGYDAMEELQAGAETVTIESTMWTADDEAVPVEIDLSLLSSETSFEGLVGVVHDRTELVRTRADLEDERDRFQYLFDELPDAVVETEFVDGRPRIREVNPAFEELFGYEESEIRGESLDDLVVPDERRGDAERLNVDAMEAAFNMAEVERETADGPRTFLFRGFLYSTGGDAKRGFGIYTDITDRLEQERRLRVLHRVLRHNLRNEMTAIIGYADLLSRDATAPETREYADRILQQATDVARLGEQVQRIEQALDRDRRRRSLDPEAVVSTVADRLRKAHPEATITVSRRDEGNVVADDLLELAVENLLENAIEHHDGTPTVEVELAAAGETHLEVTVRDDGPGIPERERAVVSGEREITQLDHSRGLGLWVTRWVVEGVGGELRFGDCEEGTAVTLRLQRLPPGESPA